MLNSTPAGWFYYYEHWLTDWLRRDLNFLIFAQVVSCIMFCQQQRLSEWLSRWNLSPCCCALFTIWLSLLRTLARCSNFTWCCSQLKNTSLHAEVGGTTLTIFRTSCSRFSRHSSLLLWTRLGCLVRQLVVLVYYIAPL